MLIRRIAQGIAAWSLTACCAAACVVEDGTDEPIDDERVGIAQSKLGQTCSSDGQCGSGELCCTPPPGYGMTKRCSTCCNILDRGCSGLYTCATPCDTSWYNAQCCFGSNEHFCDRFNTCHSTFSYCITNCIDK